jgi:hypothetical protein
VRYLYGTSGVLFKWGGAYLRRPAVAARLDGHAFRPPEGTRAWVRCGLGHELFSKGESLVFDPMRSRAYPRPRGLTGILVRPGRWLAKRVVDLRAGPAPHILFDPDTGATAPVEGEPIVRAFDVLPDGRVLVPRGRALVLADPEKGTSAPLGLEAVGAAVLGRTPGGFVVLEVFREVAAPGGRLRVLAATDDDTLLGVLDDRALVRARFGRAGHEVLFPR